MYVERVSTGSSVNIVNGVQSVYSAVLPPYHSLIVLLFMTIDISSPPPVQCTCVPLILPTRNIGSNTEGLKMI